MSNLHAGPPPPQQASDSVTFSQALSNLTAPPRATSASDAPGGRHFVTLLKAFRASGGAMPGAVVARLLQEHGCGDALSLAKLVFMRQIFGFEWRARLWIPMFQFDSGDLSVKPGLRQVRAELPASWPGWKLTKWFAEPNIWLDGQRPVDLFDSNLSEIVSAAQALCAHGAFLQAASPSQGALRRVLAIPFPVEPRTTAMPAM